MHTRALMKKDARYMLEWMKDNEVVKYLANNFGEMQLEDCEKFILNSESDKENIHLAICSDDDEYLGTVSLKHIDYKNKNAEYAISTRSCAHGTGAATYGTHAILRIAFKELELNRVYLNVITENKRANAFYKKMGFECEGCFREHLFIRDEYWDLNWYAITKRQYIESKEG